jgi:hypothetical protein
LFGDGEFVTWVGLVRGFLDDDGWEQGQYHQFADIGHRQDMMVSRAEEGQRINDMEV